MKLYLIAGGLLLTAASVYGVTDYVQTKNKKEFKELYREVPVTQVKEISVKDIQEEDFSRGKIEAPHPVKEVAAVSKVSAKDSKKKKSKTSLYSNASVKEEITLVEAEAPKETVTEPQAPVIKTSTEKKSLKRKISMKKFSRAPLKEEVLIEEKKQ